jgi:anaphase-promoting complex subunit 3
VNLKVALSALCHEMQEMSRNSVETCLALGNCFSQQREHDTAIKFFKRAVQLHDKCAYAFTLLGNTHIFKINPVCNKLFLNLNL